MAQPPANVLPPTVNGQTDASSLNQPAIPVPPEQQQQQAQAAGGGEATTAAQQQQPAPAAVPPSSQDSTSAGQQQQAEQPNVDSNNNNNSSCRMEAFEVCSTRSHCANITQMDCARQGDDLVFDVATQECRSIFEVPECEKGKQNHTTILHFCSVSFNIQISNLLYPKFQSNIAWANHLDGHWWAANAPRLLICVECHPQPIHSNHRIRANCFAPVTPL